MVIAYLLFLTGVRRRAIILLMLTALTASATVFSLTLGIWILARDPRSRLHQVFAVGMLSLGAEAAFAALGEGAPSEDAALVWMLARHMAMATGLGAWILFSFVFGRPDRKPFARRWRWALLPAAAAPLAFVLIFRKTFFVEDVAINLTGSWMIPLGPPGYWFYHIFLLGAVVILMNMERVFRHSLGHVRWRTKFLVLGLGGIYGLRIFTASQVVLFKVLAPELELSNLAALLAGSALMLISLRRTRMLEINVEFSQTVIFHSLTVLLVGIYFLLVGVLVKLIQILDLGDDFSLQVMIVLLAVLFICILMLSDRVRRRVKEFISRHLKRPLYDYRKEWTAFTEATASVTDPDELCKRVSERLSRVLDALSVTVWLMEESPERVRLAASTLFNADEGRQEQVQAPAKNFLKEMIAGRGAKEKIGRKTSWTRETRSSNSEAYRRMESFYWAPLEAGGKLLGAVALADRVGARSFSIEDEDLLKAILSQTAASLLNLKLLENLRRAKEIEAFQTMSAFMIHDLKNLGNSLSLTMENLPVHFENPEFRAEALGIIQKSVQKINNICRGLSLLRQAIELKPMPSDLKHTVKQAVDSLGGGLAGTALEYKLD
ncbi:MAG: GAF domain-containing protein, partial [Desulfobacteraceae bacterium]